MPPGWPTPPEGWRPEPGWTPPASWPPAPQGWQFWVADSTASPAPLVAHQQQGGYPPAAPRQRQAPKSRTTVIAFTAIGAVVLGAAVIGSALNGTGNGSQPDPTGTPTATAAADDPTTDAESSAGDDTGGSEASTSADTDSTSAADLLNSDEVVVMRPEDAAYAAADGLVDGALVPAAEIRLLDVVSDWQPTQTDGVLPCEEPTHGQFLGLQVEVTVLPDVDGPVTVQGLGWYSGANGSIVEDGSATWSPTLSCVSDEDRLPSEMAGGQTYTGWLAMDAPADADDVIYTGWTDHDHPWFVWRIADYS